MGDLRILLAAGLESLNTSSTRKRVDFLIHSLARRACIGRHGVRFRYSALRVVSSITAAILLLASLGCRNSEPLDDYGVHHGSNAKRSISGTTVFRSMFRTANHRTYSLDALSERAKKLDTIVLIPTEFRVPNRPALDWLDAWLSTSGKRKTLIYIGRDYCAANDYWSAAAEQAGPIQAVDFRIEQALARSEHDLARASAPNRSYARWFVLDYEWPVKHIDLLSGPWAMDIDASKADLSISGRVLPVDQFTDEDLNQDFNWKPKIASVPGPKTKRTFMIDDDDEPIDLQDSAETPHRKIQSEVLLADGDGTPLVFRITKERWGENDILVVVNGSPILNSQLVNRETQKIASKIIGSIEKDAKVGFLLAGSSIRVRDGSQDEHANGFELLAVWPLNMITLHAAFLGLITLGALWPIFGRPQSLPKRSTTDFGQHVEALGDLLYRSRDREYAMKSIREYFRNVRNEHSHVWANAGITTEEPKS